MKSTIAKIGVCAVLLSALSASVNVFAEEGGSLNSNGVIKFMEDTDGTDPTDPDNPDPTDPVDPIDPTDPDGQAPEGTAGPLSLDFVPSFDFGQHTLSISKEEYLAKSLKYNDEDMGKTVNYAQVTDKRKASAKGWTLMLTQDAQFKAGEKELQGAVFSINQMEARTNVENPSLAPTTGKFKNITIGEPHVIMAANEEQGKGLWVNRLGTLTEELTDQEDVAKGDDAISDQYNDGVTLMVPANVADDLSYSTTFTWTLTNTPGIAEAGI